MKDVYLLRSVNHPQKHYIGSTADLKRRLKEHNNGQSIRTNRFKPWKIKFYLAFCDASKADKFEIYLSVEQYLKTANLNYKS